MLPVTTKITLYLGHWPAEAKESRPRPCCLLEQSPLLSYNIDRISTRSMLSRGALKENNFNGSLTVGSGITVVVSFLLQ